MHKLSDIISYSENGIDAVYQNLSQCACLGASIFAQNLDLFESITSWVHFFTQLCLIDSNICI